MAQVGLDFPVTIYHNPKCQTSRNALAFIKEKGIEPTIIEYLKNPPTLETLQHLSIATGLGVRGIMRQKEPLYLELGLNNPELTDAELLKAMLQHPILINRPIVITPKGTCLARPSEHVLTVLPN